MRPHLRMKPSYNTIREAKQDIIRQLDKKARNRRPVFTWMGIKNTPEWKVKKVPTFRLAIELWDEGKGFTVTRPPRPQSDSKPSATDNVAGGPSQAHPNSSPPSNSITAGEASQPHSNSSMTANITAVGQQSRPNEPQRSNIERRLALAQPRPARPVQTKLKSTQNTRPVIGNTTDPFATAGSPASMATTATAEPASRQHTSATTRDTGTPTGSALVDPIDYANELDQNLTETVTGVDRATVADSDTLRLPRQRERTTRNQNSDNA
jgi:hypothetical protein